MSFGGRGGRRRRSAIGWRRRGGWLGPGVVGRRLGGRGGRGILGRILRGLLVATGGEVSSYSRRRRRRRRRSGWGSGFSMRPGGHGRKTYARLARGCEGEFRGRVGQIGVARLGLALWLRTRLWNIVVACACRVGFGRCAGLRMGGSGVVARGPRG